MNKIIKNASIVCFSSLIAISATAGPPAPESDDPHEADHGPNLSEDNASIFYNKWRVS